MCGGGTQTTTQQVTIPPEVMARYNSVNARAENVAATPFQAYTGEFVAPLNETQQQGIQATGQASQSAQPYYQMGTGLTLAGTQAVGPLTSGQISTYMNPYIEGVVDPTLRALQQQQGQQLSQQQADAIKGGAFGGERSGIQRAMLQGQQNLATGQAIAPLYAQGYQQAVQTATGQQGVKAQDLARLAQAGQQIAGLGTGAQAAGLQGAQAQIAAGTLGQQTSQAQKTAEYQQFLQERGYPYQQAQFLANIAMGTGALSGSTTTTESPAGFFSDKRLKENLKVVGETNDGQPIYRYNYKGDPKTQLGLIAQEVEKDHPEAVGESQGYKTVDYKKATDDSVRHHRAYGGGLDVNAFGGAVTGPGGYAGGGLVDSTDLSAILAQQRNFFGPYGKGLVGEGQVGGASGIPAASLAVPKLVTAAGMPQQQRSGLSQAAETGSSIAGLYKTGKSALVGDKEDAGLFGKNGNFSREGLVSGAFAGKKPEATADLPAAGAKPASSDMYEPNAFDSTGAGFYIPGEMNRGGVVPRGYAGGGEINPYALSADPMADVVQEGTQKAPELTKPSQAPGVKSPMSDVKDAVGLAGSVASAGTAIANFLPMILAMSDERLKHDKEKVGELFDGQPVYRYHFGDGATQMGLLAQNVEKDHPEAVHETSHGIKMVDYDAATRDAANDRHGYSFGGMPRQGYATRGGVSQPSSDEPVITNPDEAAAAPHPADSIFEKRIIPRESAGKQFDKDGKPLTSPAGAIGIAQVMPGTAPEAAKMAGLVFDEDKYRNDPEYNKALGKAYFRAQYDRYNDPEMAMAAYNAGPGNVDKSIQAARSTGGDWRSFLPNETKNYIGAPANLSAGKQAGVPAQSGQGSFSLASMLPTQKDASGKESTNWEKVLIPLLSGVGSALSSTRNTLGGALGEGLLGAVGGYQGISKMQAELPKIEAETKTQNATTDRINILTRVARAGMLDAKFVPDVGLQVFDKETLVPVTVTDKYGKPLPEARELVQEFLSRNPTFNLSAEAKKASEAGMKKIESPSVSGTPTKSTDGKTTTEQGVVSDISKFVPPDVRPSEWNAVTQVPEGYQPKGQGAMMSPFNENRGKYTERGNQQVAALQNKALTAPDTQLIIDKMSKDLTTVNRDKFTAAGPTAVIRNNIAGGINEAARVFGYNQVIDPSNVAAFESIQKGTANLGYKTANSVTNSRIPFELVKSATQANPQIINSPLGAAVLLRNIEQGVQLERDKAAFFASYLRRFENVEDALTAFETLNPARKYVERGIYKAMEDFIPQQQRDYLNQYLSREDVAGDEKKKAAAIAKFDKQVGVNGAAKILLGEK